jgi:hypothetical protein
MRPFIILVSLALAFASAAAQTTAPVYKQRGGANADDIAGSLRFPTDTTLELKAGSTLVMQLAHVRTILDLLGADRGSIIYRGASGWTVLAPGTSGYALLSGGAGADPYYGAIVTSVSWGGITGTLASQADLQAALGAKQAAATAATDAELSAGLAGKQDAATAATDSELSAGLAGKADSVHTHALSAITQSGASSGQVPKWNGSAWVPDTDSTGALDIDALVEATEADLAGTDRIVISDGGTEKGLSLTNLRDYLQSMAWTFAVINATALNVTDAVALPDDSTAATQAASDNSTKVATTAYVDSAVAGVSTSGINIVSSWPGSPSAGQWYVNTVTERLRYYPNTADYHESSAYTFADATAPTLSSATIPTTGDSITLAFTEAVSIGAGGNAGWVPTLTGGASAMTYSSGDGTSSLVYTLARTVESGETGTLAYTQPGDGLEDAAGNDLATIASAAIVNNSTATGGPTYLLSLDCDTAGTPGGVTDSGAIEWGDTDAPNPLVTGGGWRTSSSTAFSLATFAQQSGRVDLFEAIRFADISGQPTGAIIEDAAGNDLAYLRILSTGSIRIYCGTTNLNATGYTYTADTTLYYWVDYTPGLGANAVAHLYLSSSQTKPGSPNATITNGNATGEASQLRMITQATTVATRDKIRVDDEAIGSSPQ